MVLSHPPTGNIPSLVDRTTNSKVILIRVWMSLCAEIQEQKNEGKWREKDAYLLNEGGRETSLTKLVILHVICETLIIRDTGLS